MRTDHDVNRPLRRVAKVAVIGATGVAAGVTIGAAAAGVLGWKLFRSATRPDNWRGKVVVITGGSRGLGLALAHEAARHGARVAICARDQGELETARKQIGIHAEVGTYVCDVTNYDEVISWINSVRSDFGQIDILINNAGQISVGPLESQMLTDFQEALDAMYWGVVYPTLAVLPHMKARGQGSIANIASIGGKVSVPHLLPYCAAKFAALGFSEGLHAELAKSGIHVTTVVPGLMRTGSHLNAFFKGDHRREFTWFALAATLPVVSISAESAAQKIVSAIRHHRAEVILSPQAKALALLHGVAPGLTCELMGVVNRVLPASQGDPSIRHTGSESETAVTRSFATQLGRRAARNLNQGPAMQAS
jgi:short-subunit dehydrogenase